MCNTVVLMAKRRMTTEELLEQQHYKAIMYLIGTFQHKDIRFLHLNYALVEKNNISKKTINELEEFFEGRLKFPPFNYLFYESLLYLKNFAIVMDKFNSKTKMLEELKSEKRIIKGKRGINNLTNFLRRLREERLIEKYSKGVRFPFYHLTNKGELLFNKIVLKELANAIRSPDDIKSAIGMLNSIIMGPSPF